MKVSTEIDNNFGHEKITQLVDNIPLSKKQTVECQLYPFLQAHLDRCNVDNHQIKNCSETEHHLYN